MSIPFYEQYDENISNASLNGTTIDHIGQIGTSIYRMIVVYL